MEKRSAKFVLRPLVERICCDSTGILRILEMNRKDGKQPVWSRRNDKLRNVDTRLDLRHLAASSLTRTDLGVFVPNFAPAGSRSNA